MNRCFNRYNLFFYLIIFSLMILQSCGTNSSSGKIKIPRLRPQFSYKDREPMGGYLAYNYASHLFNNESTSVPEKAFSDLQLYYYEARSLYIIHANQVRLSQRDINAMLHFVDKGNQILISANFIDHRRR